MEKNLKISIVIPIHDTPKGADFLWRCINSIMRQTYTNYEIIITKEGKTSENTNAGIMKATGDIIKFLHMDDFFTNKYTLQDLVNGWDKNTQWVVMGTDNNLNPHWTDDIMIGNNKIGAPSAIAIINKNPPLYNEKLVWLLDCDYYHRLYARYGNPKIMSGRYVDIGIHEDQMTHQIPNDIKIKEIDNAKKYV